MYNYETVRGAFKFCIVILCCLPLRLAAHHEAIFGPQSTTLIAHKRFVSTQYYFVNEGQAPAESSHSHIGIISASTGLGRRWSVSAALPFEIQGGSSESVQGVHDPVFAARYFADVGANKMLVAAITVEPPASSLEVRALGTGAGIIYGAERGHWSGIAYALGRTEHSFQQGQRRGNRFFVGGGVAFEAERLPFSPQLGLSYERTGPRHEDGVALDDTRISAVMLHPTIVKTCRDERYSVFLVGSAPVAQWSGNDGWQRYRIATGITWSF